MAELLAEKHVISSYSNCYNCGKYIATDIDGKTLYCCRECMEIFASCEICGKYYPAVKKHTDSLKCLVKFDLNRKGYPFIRQAMLKLFITGNPLLNMELMAERLSLVLKQPCFMSEKFRIQENMSAAAIHEAIKERTRSENIPEYFIFLGNSHNADFLNELFMEIEFDRFIILDSSKSGDFTENKNTASKLRICSNCGNINCFSLSDFEGRAECLVCGNEYYRSTESETSVQQKIKYYQDCKTLITSSFPEKTAEKKFTSVHETVNNIVKYLIHT